MKKKSRKGQKPVRWTEEEDKTLLKYVDVYPHNLSKCFMIVSEITGRSKGAVAAHWYSVVSKRDDVWKFVTLSSQHCSKNRKNGVGETSSQTIWNRVLRIVKTLFSKERK